MLNEVNIQEIKSILLAELIFADAPMCLYRLKKGFASFTEVLQAIKNDEFPNTFWEERKIKEDKVAACKHPSPHLLAAVDEALEWGSKNLQHLVTLNDSCYPELLKRINFHPPILFVKGAISILANRQIAIVGSRNPSSWGLEHAQEFAAELVTYGFTITSGLALGIDAAAHAAALAAKGKTIAVMGSGFNNIYPKTNRILAEKIANEGGAILSEFPLSFPPLPRNFPQRNRIISGLSWGTLVIEANLRSGSLITAHLAAEQGREVFAIPGSIDNPLALGCHKLIREGAKLVDNVFDIIEEFTELQNLEICSRRTHINSKHKEIAAKNLAISPREKGDELDDDNKKLLASIGYEITSVDTLLRRSNLTISQIMSMLALLELKQYIRKDMGGYTKIRQK